jgi:plastocyanin
MGGGVTRLLIALTLALALVPGSAAMSNPILTATVGPGFSISLVDASGNPVTNLDPGTYTFEVHDRSTLHSFHLTGPGVDMATTINTTSDPNWTLTLADGSYHFFCDAHPTTLRGDFTVGTPPASPPPPPVATKLSGKVGPGTAISLKMASGAVAKILKAGVYAITVRDLSAVNNFHLTGPGVNRRTSVAGKATVTWRVTLVAGVYRYRSDAHPALKGSVTVRAA